MDKLITNFYHATFRNTPASWTLLWNDSVHY